MTSDGKMASARDFGNMGAGIMATRNGVGVDLAKWQMNKLQGGQEPPVSAKAQAIGYDIGKRLMTQDQIKFQKWRTNARRQASQHGADWWKWWKD